MDLPITRAQRDAILGARDLPDVLRRVLDRAAPTPDGVSLRLSYEEATALSELCSWNVHTDAAGTVTADSKVFDDLVRAIITHPDY
ncbi:MAG TPA: hypothetical protein VI160_04615 [Gemmatimonadales bacterium]